MSSSLNNTRRSSRLSSAPQPKPTVLPQPVLGRQSTPRKAKTTPPSTSIPTDQKSSQSPPNDINDDAEAESPVQSTPRKLSTPRKPTPPADTSALVEPVTRPTRRLPPMTPLNSNARSSSLGTSMTSTTTQSYTTTPQRPSRTRSSIAAQQSAPLSNPQSQPQLSTSATARRSAIQSRPEPNTPASSSSTPITPTPNATLQSSSQKGRQLISATLKSNQYRPTPTKRSMLQRNDSATQPASQTSSPIKSRINVSNPLIGTGSKLAPSRSTLTNTAPPSTPTNKVGERVKKRSLSPLPNSSRNTDLINTTPLHETLGSELEDDDQPMTSKGIKSRKCSPKSSLRASSSSAASMHDDNDAQSGDENDEDELVQLDDTVEPQNTTPPCSYTTSSRRPTVSSKKHSLHKHLYQSQQHSQHSQQHSQPNQEFADFDGHFSLDDETMDLSALHKQHVINPQQISQEMIDGDSIVQQTQEMSDSGHFSSDSEDSLDVDDVNAFLAECNDEFNINPSESTLFADTIAPSTALLNCPRRLSLIISTSQTSQSSSQIHHPSTPTTSSQTPRAGRRSETAKSSQYDYLAFAQSKHDPNQLNERWNWAGHSTNPADAHRRFFKHPHVHDCSFDNDQTWNIFNYDKTLYSQAELHLAKGSHAFLEQELRLDRRQDDPATFGFKQNPADEHSFDLHTINVLDEAHTALRTRSFHPRIHDFACIDTLITPNFEWSQFCHPQDVMAMRLLSQKEERILDYAYGLMYDKFFTPSQQEFEYHRLNEIFLQQQRQYTSFTIYTQVDHQIPSAPVDPKQLCSDTNPDFINCSLLSQHFYAGQQLPTYHQHLQDPTTIPRFFVQLLIDATSELRVSFVRSEQRYVTYYPTDTSPDSIHDDARYDPDDDDMFDAKRYAAFYLGAPPSVVSNVKQDNHSAHLELYRQQKNEIEVMGEEPAQFSARALYIQPRSKSRFRAKGSELQRTIAETRQRIVYCRELIFIIKQLRRGREYLQIPTNPDILEEHGFGYTKESLAVYTRLVNQAMEHEDQFSNLDRTELCDDDIDDDFINDPSQAHIECTLHQLHIFEKKLQELVQTARSPRFRDFHDFFQSDLEEQKVNSATGKCNFLSILINTHLGEYKYPLPVELTNGTFPQTYDGFERYTDYVRTAGQNKFPHFQTTQRSQFQKYLDSTLLPYALSWLFAHFYVDKYLTPPPIDYSTLYTETSPLTEHYRFNKAAFGTFEPSLKTIDPLITKPIIKFSPPTGAKKNKRVRFGNVNIATIQCGPDISKATLGIGLTPILVSIEVLSVDAYQNYQSKCKSELLLVHDVLRRDHWFNTFTYIAAMDWHIRLGNYKSSQAGNFIQALAQTPRNQTRLQAAFGERLYPTGAHDPSHLTQTPTFHSNKAYKNPKDDPFYIHQDHYTTGDPYWTEKDGWIFDFYFIDQKIRDTKKLDKAEVFKVRGQTCRMVSPTCYIFDPVDPWEIFETDSPMYQYVVDMLCEYRSIHWNEHVRRNSPVSPMQHNHTTPGRNQPQSNLIPYKATCPYKSVNEYPENNSTSYYFTTSLRFREFNDSTNEQYDSDSSSGCADLCCNGEQESEDEQGKSAHKHETCSCAVIGLHCSNETCGCCAQGVETNCANPFGTFAFLDAKSSLFNEKMLRLLSTYCYEHVKVAYAEFKGQPASNSKAVCFYGVPPERADEAKMQTKKMLFDQGLPLYAPQIYEDFNPIHQYNTISALTPQDYEVGPDHVDLKQFKWTTPRGYFSSDYSLPPQ